MKANMNLREGGFRTALSRTIVSGVQLLLGADQLCTLNCPLCLRRRRILLHFMLSAVISTFGCFSLF